MSLYLLKLEVFLSCSIRPVRLALRAGISFTPRGEFSVIIATMATDTIRLFSGGFILSSAMSGILLFQLEPKITNMLYPKKETVKK